MFKLVKLTLLITTLFFSTASQATSLAYDMVIPDDVPREKVVCFELVEKNYASAIYRIETSDGDVLYQVVSVVVMKVLPSGIELACNAMIKNPVFCKYVKHAGEALIGAYSGQIKDAIKHWTTKVVGNTGVAKVTSSNYQGAQDAHKAFFVSKNETGYPWSAPVIENYRDMNFGN